MKKITDTSVVEIHYKLTNSKNEILEDTRKKGSLTFLKGQNQILPALENEISSRELGESFSIEIENAYGSIQEKLIQSVAKDQFGKDSSKLTIGMQFEVESNDGQVLIATIKELKKNEVILDANHPLAGETLKFEVEVIGLRAATEKELKEGLFVEKTSSCSCC